MLKKTIKKITIRLGKRDYSEGRVMLCCPNNSWCVERNINNVEFSKLKYISDQVAQEDGFINQEDLFNKLKEYYSDVNDESEMTIVRWN